MVKTSMSTDRLDALRRVCDAYGGDPARWPADARAEFSDLAEEEEAAGAPRQWHSPSSDAAAEAAAVATRASETTQPICSKRGSAGAPSARHSARLTKLSSVLHDAS